MPVKRPGRDADLHPGWSALKEDQALSGVSASDRPGPVRSDRWPLPLLDRVLSSAGVRLVELDDDDPDQRRPAAGQLQRPPGAPLSGSADQPEAGRQPARMPQVLLVDDSPAMRRVLRALLEDAGIEVVGEAADGAEGVELAAALRPEVVLMDWRMPRLDGVQATARIRQRLPEVQVVMFSSLEGAGIGVAAREAGASAFVGKGASPDQLCAAVLAAAPPA
jgi:CheY-like chemotaxis protein